MKALVTVAFEGDRQEFADAAVGQLSNVVAAGDAARAAVEIRPPDEELAAFGPELMTQQQERAVIALWGTEPERAISLALPGDSRQVGVYKVDEVVQKDYECTWPTGTQSPGFKMIAFLQRRDELT